MPYREGPALLLCPRCGEVLDRVFGGVSACSRCRGAWVNQTTLDTAFGNPRWPAGQNLWWHQALECPACAIEGQISSMDARRADSVMVDVCPSHGVWLDHGELGRLMKLEAGTDELLALKRRVSEASADPDELVQRRLAWRTELDARRRTAQEFRTWLEQEHRRKQEEAAERDRVRAQLAAERKRTREVAARRERRNELVDERTGALHEVRALEARLVAVKQDVARLEGELVAARSRLREIDAEIEAELDGGELK